MCEQIDIAEDEIFKISPRLLQILLKDHSTSRHFGCDRNIFWATRDYEGLGDGYSFHDQITSEKITGKHGLIIRPRARKSLSEQRRRVTDKAEVFTPAWICNKQNNLVDNAWFGCEAVFNTENDEGNKHTWQATSTPIKFPDTKGKTWRDYVHAARLEMACGEAPYLVSRYDATTCDCLIPVPQRIGLLDRKLRIVGENTTTPAEWLIEAFNALHNTYGFEWQGDNLLLAREALLYTFKEHYEHKFCDTLKSKILENAAYIISWNVWQMDGVKCVVPDSCNWSKNLFGKKGECDACKKGSTKGHIGIPCLVVEWKNVTAKAPTRTGSKRYIYRYPAIKNPYKSTIAKNSMP